MIMFKINNVSYWSETGSEQQSLMLVRVMDGNLPQRGGMATFNHLLIGSTLSPNNHSLQSVSD